VRYSRHEERDECPSLQAPSLPARDHRARRLLPFRFSLSYRDVEELLAERGVIVTYETVRQWCRKFGQSYANELRRRRPLPGDEWHLDEVFVQINGVQHYLWRAADQDGNVLDTLVQPRRDKRAAVKFLRKLLKGLASVPRVVITDNLASYGAALREILRSVEHRRHKGLNNRAENAHQPTRERERRMRRFKDPGHAQRFLAAYGPIASHFRPCRHRLTAAYRVVTGTPPWPERRALQAASCLRPPARHLPRLNLTIPIEAGKSISRRVVGRCMDIRC
jgi:putative transposase